MIMQTKSTCYKKRILSILVTLSLFVSMFPTSFMFAAANTPTTQTINFAPESGNSSPADYTIADHGWKLDTANTSSTIPGRTDNWVVYPKSFWKAQMSMDEQVVLDFKLEQAGTFNVSVLGWQVDNAGIIGKFTIDGIAVGSFNFSHPEGSGTNQNASGKIGTISLSAGEHKLRILRTNTTSGGDLLFISALEFEAVENAIPGEQYVDFCVPSGSKAPSEFKLNLDGWQVDSENTTCPQSGGNYIVQVDPYGLKAVMNPNESIVLDFNVALDGFYDVTLRGTQFNGLGLTAAVLIDGTSLESYSFHTPNGEEMLTGAEKSVGKIALTAGAHKLTIQRTDTTSSGYMFFAGMRLTPTTKDPSDDTTADTQIVLDFKKEWEKPENERRSPLDASIAVDGWQVNQEKTAASLITGSTTFRFQPYGINAQVMDAGFPKHSELAIDFAVESEGVYNVSFSGGQYGETDGATVGIYVDDVHLGNYRFVGDNLLVGENKELGGIALTKGTHTVTMRRVNTGNPSFMFPGCISFSMAAPMRTEKTLNFIAAHAKEYLGGTSGTPLDATIETHGWQINREKSAGSITSTLKPGYQGYGIVAQINDANYEKHSDLVFDFNLDKEANYVFSLSGSQYDGGTVVDVYVDAQKVGNYDFSGSAGTGGNIAVFPKLHLTSGEHSVTLRRTAGADGGSYMFPGQIRIVEDMTASNSFNFGIQTFDKDGNPKTDFSVGDTVYAKVMLDGGSDFQFGAVQADIVYDNTKLELVGEETSAQEGFTINKAYSANSVRLAYGGSEISATSPYMLGTIALRVKRGITSGETVVSYANTNVSKYNNTEWEISTANGATLQLHNLTVSFTAGTNGTMETATFYTKYNTAGLYTDDSYATAATEPTPAANTGWRIADENSRWAKDGSEATSFVAINATALTENAEYVAQYVEQKTVTFLPGDHGTIQNGGIITVDVGTILTAQQVPTPTPEANYVFAGWKNEDGETVNPVGMTISADTKYTALYSKEIDVDGELKTMTGVSGYKILSVEPGKLPDGKAYQYNGKTMLYSEAHNAYLCLVPESDTEAASKISLVDGNVPTVERGKINGDDVVDTLDAMLAYTYYNNVDGKFDALIAEQNAQILFALDYNGDFAIDILDVTAIIVAYVGLA